MTRIPPRENLDYKVASPPANCACPQCGVIHQRLIELAHSDNPYAWRRGGYLVILCVDCRDANKARREIYKGDDIE